MTSALPQTDMQWVAIATRMFLQVLGASLGAGLDERINISAASPGV